jgi:isoleucyl-tRNA synthetase
MPFYAEYLFLAVRNEGEPESVHLAAWPKAGLVDEAKIAMMQKTRTTVTIALEARAKSGIKIRQPLASLTINGDSGVLSEEHVALIRDEINVKQVFFASGLLEDVKLDLEITKELKAEGDVREFMRAIQDLRKQSGLMPQDRITLSLSTENEGELLVTAFAELIKKTVGASAVMFAPNEGVSVKAGDITFVVALSKN